MKQIKFRAWDNGWKEIVYPDIIYHNINLGITIHKAFRTDSGDTYFPLQENLTLMQFTGLLDCEGKEVYEGDILEVTSNNDGQKYITTFKVNLINGLYIDNLSLCMDMCLYDYGITSSNCKVIGNLYEHPQLLNND